MITDKIGIGYDVHRLEKGRPLMLAGVRVPFEMGLRGHSDGDVLTHAIIDALLGAAGLPDIGQQFPDTDPQYRDISSLILLKRAGELVGGQGFTIVNVDTALLAEAPRIAPQVDAMRACLGEAMGIAARRVAVKAKT
ncbi:hypothetical protein LCGC14_2412870, partial [marine sediment metagenome]